MSKFGVFFGGRDVQLPGAYGQVFSDLVSPGGVPSRAVAILGLGLGGEVGSYSRVQSPDQFKSVLVGGVLAQLTEASMFPSPDVQGCVDNYAIRVNKATAAILAGGDGTFTSRLKGKIGQSTKLTRTITAGVENITVFNAQVGITESFENLRPAIEIKYVGAFGSPTVAVTSPSSVPTLTLTGTVVTVITAEQVQTVAQMIDTINNTAEWTARAAGSLSGLLFSDIEVKAYPLVALTVPLTIGNNATVYALEGSQLLSYTPSVGTATAINGAYLAGGTEGPAVTIADWLDALTVADTLEVDSIVIGTGDVAVLAAAAGRVRLSSDVVNRKERRLYCGPDKSNNKTQLITTALALASSLGNERVIISAIEPQLVDKITNRPTTYASFYAAAMLAGADAGNSPRLNMTQKRLSFITNSYKFTVQELKDFDEKGVTTVTFDDESGQWKVTHSITSYTKDNNLGYREVSGMKIIDWLNKKIRNRVKSYIGETGDAASITGILRTVKTALDEEVTSKLNRQGLLTAGSDPATGKAVPAYENIEVVFGANGLDVVGVSYTAHPVLPINKILITATLTPVRITARA